MNDEEFRKLYCWLIESIRPSKEVVERVLRNVLNALKKNQNRCTRKRIEQTKDRERITQDKIT